MHLDPISLRLFISVIEEGTISAASEREHIAAAAISKRISELESAFKTTLLLRTNKGIQPTTAGMALSSLARRALRELDEVSVHMKEYSSGLRGFVRVFANISAITQFLPQDIKTFLSDYPNIQVHLEEKVTPMILKSVYENSADIGIFSETSLGHELEILPYKADRLALIVPSGHPLAKRWNGQFSDALDYDFVGLHAGSAINQIVANAAAELDRRVSIKVQVTGFDSLCFMVDSGLGIGVLPLGIAQRYARIFDIDILLIDEPWVGRHLQICVRSFNALPRAAQLFVKHLSQESTD
ncbi:LysR family transcriptional regulator [Pusillimonas sp. T7-7]|uniref:LysR substrate-binding domain-containing protein n=1 Tax=Pusillimonas sp. (strain T7-7) TaxID=1007105 RepID=UPI0002085476|nr:LysR substrate-binding domain-containing protein [Pusillimonas sp. T7-7]AEC21930.1 LysR family transcriptional regulator [Pusillimonas sp. T7-7]